MNRTARNVALAGVALALLFFSTGAKAQDDDASSEGYGKLPPDLPPLDDRTSPSQPGGPSGGPAAQPSGDAIIPNPQRTGKGGAMSIDVAWSTWPETPTRFIKDRDPEEYAYGVLVVYVPWSLQESENNDALLNAELIIEDWAELYGYRTVHIVYQAPESHAYTAEAWNDGAQLGVYDLEVSYLPAYLQTLGKVTGALRLAFVAGLVNWLHGT